MLTDLPESTLHVGRLLRGAAGLVPLKVGGDGKFTVGEEGVEAILTPLDRKIELICYREKTLCFVKSSQGCPALYPLEPARIERPVKAVLMDLDGTTVRSERFWVRVIEMTTARLADDPDFELEDQDLPHVSGHSVTEHLQYCIDKYCQDKSIEDARGFYFDITREQMRLISNGLGWADAFVPAEGLKDFLLDCKSRGIRLGLVTSGLYEKAWPEILSAFGTMGMGDPREFYDAIITAGFPLRDGEPGTLGELTPKPHPWLYAETCRVGLGIDYKDRHHVLGIEDSSAGVVAIRLAGYAAVGMAGGNIEDAGVGCLCSHFCESLAEVPGLF